MKNKNLKLKASTIIETLVASVIIILIFTIASLTLNNIFKGVVKNDVSKIENHLTKLMYLQQNEKFDLPYQEDFKDWEIYFYRETKHEVPFLIIEATNKTSKKNIQKLIIDVDS
ncbi:MAG: hypothetical protein L3J08_01550 [Flavobacteriaceae bacterium]|nr:hypothetical protein [Flavobacteriaceae bacterium]